MTPTDGQTVMGKNEISKWEVRKRAFRIWQQKPHEVAPISDTLHVCQSCGTEFHGNYCPRCGQSAKVGRFSFKKAFLLFLDIWGVGNRGMFRSIRDLMLRPGYMIRDYVSGRQSAYFPPFKMFFILATFSLLLSHGIDLSLEDEPQKADANSEKVVPDSITFNGRKIAVDEWEKTDSIDIDGSKIAKGEGEVPNGITLNGKKIETKTIQFFQKIPRMVMALEKKSPSLFAFLLLVLISAPLYLFLRRCPAVPDLRYSEHLVALVYTSNMYTLYQMLANVLPIGSGLIRLAAVFMIFVALQQFTGYTKRRLLGYIALVLLFCLVLVILIAIFVIALLYFSA